MPEETKLLLPYNLQWFAQDGEGGEKTEPATQKKLDDARKEGQVAKSQELNAVAALLTLFILLKVFVSFLGERFYYVFNWIYSIIPDVIASDRSGLTISTVSRLMNGAILQVLIILSPFLIASFVAGLVISILQVGWKITGKPLEPKPDKLNPVNGFKRIFSKDSLFNLVKNIAKVFLIFYVAYLCLKNEADSLYIIYEIPLNQGLALVGNLIINTGLKISLVYILVGVADYIYQRHKFSEDMKMTKQEVKDEYKSTEGDPQIKGRQRQMMRQASQRRMMADVPKADVVITNPTHLSCAIRYDSELESAPTLLAKGEDYIALKIREVAKENGVPLVENKPLARAIYSTVEVGSQIPPELYQAVAEILAVVYSNR